MQSEWSLSHGRDGYAVTLYEVPWYVNPAQTVADRFLRFTRHWLCCRMPEWTWKLPLGKPRYDRSDTEPWLENSLGSALWTFGQKTSLIFEKKRKHMHSIPIDLETAQKLSPEWVAECEEIFSED